MKFTKSLQIGLLVFTSLVIAGCSSSAPKGAQESAKSEKSTSQAKKDASDFSPAPQPSSATSILPAGPATPNPYYQVAPKVSETVQVQFQAAVAAIEQKNWNTAETSLVSITNSNPNLSGAWLNLGVVYHVKGDLPKAKSALERAVKANSMNVDAYAYLALVEREQGDFSSAQNHLEKALSVWPFFADGHKNLAILFDLYMNQPEKALPHYLAYQQLLKERNLSPEAKQTETKQIDSWVADIQRRLNGGKKPEDKKAESSSEATQ